MSDLILPRRAFLTGLAGLFAAPAIVRAASLMPVKALPVYGAIPGFMTLADYARLMEQHRLKMIEAIYAPGVLTQIGSELVFTNIKPVKHGRR